MTTSPTPIPSTLATSTDRGVGRTAADRPVRRLRAVLRVNAATSALTGTVMAVAPRIVDDLLDTGHPGWVRLVGIGLVLFALDVALLSTRPGGTLRRFTPWVVAADAGWVVGSVATILLGWYSTGGAIAVAAVAAGVAGFAALQHREQRRL